jgi:endonuclease G
MKLKLLSVLLSVSAFTSSAEVHSPHCLSGCPEGHSATNDLIIRQAYTLSSNDKTKFADWIAYRLDPKTVTGNVQTKRNWKADPYLEDEETLEPADYTGAHNALKTDRGHQAPLASFKGTEYWQQTNFLSNISSVRLTFK